QWKSDLRFPLKLRELSTGIGVSWPDTPKAAISIEIGPSISIEIAGQEGRRCRAGPSSCWFRRSGSAGAGRLGFAVRVSPDDHARFAG
ncbi:hypothetical protein, partial [Saccharopolyspora sp. NPDC003762]